MKQHSFILSAGVALVLAGCTMAPKYSRPAAPVPAQWTQRAMATNPPAAANAPAAWQVNWREFITDPKLQQVIGLALTNNRDLRLASLNVERARAMYGIQRSTLWPTVNGTGSGSQQRLPADLSSTGRRQTVSRHDASLGVAGWEIDFFGRIRSLKDRALEEYLGTEQARRSAQILLISSVANAYLALAADHEGLRLVETTLQTQQGAYDLIKRRYVLGLTPELDLYRAQAQVDAARGDIARFQQQIAHDENALTLLLGAPVPAGLLPAELGGIEPLKDISAGVPSETLLRRPDVLQAENLLRAANADIGAARAAFFPRVSLTAAIGTASSDLTGLFKSGSGTWSYAPQIVMPIFDARTWSAHKAAKVQQQMAVTQYEKAIQEAFREVADTLAVQATVDDQVAAQKSLVAAVAETHRLSNSRYERGIDSYLGVLDAQRSLYAAQQGLVGLRLAKLANNVRFYAVLGGGWQAEATASASAKPASPAK